MTKELKDLIKPSPDEVLVELITETNEHIPGVKRLNKGVEAYVLVHSVGESEMKFFAQPGDYVLTKPGMSFSAFNLFGKDYSIIYKHQCQAVLDKEILPELKSDKQKNITPDKKIELIN